MAKKPPISPPADDRWWDFATLRHPDLALRHFNRNPLMLSLCVVYLLVGFLAWHLGFPANPLGWLLIFFTGSTLLKLTWVDLRLQLLPNILVGWLLILALALLISQPHTTFQTENLAAGFVLGGGFFALLAWSFEKLCGRSGLGMGDIKLLAVLGLLVGASGLPLLLLIASWASLPVILVQRLRGKKNQRFAFGPMLCLAGWVVLLFQPILWQFLGQFTGHPLY